MVRDRPHWWCLLEEREEKKKGVKQEATQAGGRLQYLRSGAGEGVIWRWGSLERQLSVLGCRWALLPALSREQQEQLLWQCWDQASFGRLGISITAALHPVGPGGVGEGSGWGTLAVPQGEGISLARRPGCCTQGARRDAKVLVCSEGSQNASCSHRVKRRKGNSKGRERV